MGAAGSYQTDSLHPAPCTLHPAPCTLHPPCTLAAGSYQTVGKERSVAKQQDVAVISGGSRADALLFAKPLAWSMFSVPRSAPKGPWGACASSGQVKPAQAGGEARVASSAAEAATAPKLPSPLPPWLPLPPSPPSSSPTKLAAVARTPA